MSRKDSVDNIKITLSLIALCVPLFVRYSVTAENSCPYETYMHLNGKCLDISEKALSNISEELDNNFIEELSEEIAEFCLEQQPQTSTRIEIREDMCQ